MKYPNGWYIEYTIKELRKQSNIPNRTPSGKVFELPTLPNLLRCLEASGIA